MAAPPGAPALSVAACGPDLQLRTTNGSHHASFFRWSPFAAPASTRKPEISQPPSAMMPRCVVVIDRHPEQGCKVRNRNSPLEQDANLLKRGQVQVHHSISSSWGPKTKAILHLRTIAAENPEEPCQEPLLAAHGGPPSAPEPPHCVAVFATALLTIWVQFSSIIRRSRLHME